jgi:hypothetical protein
LLLRSVSLTLWNKLLLTRLCHCLHNVLFFIRLLHRINFGGRFGFLLGP